MFLSKLQLAGTTLLLLALAVGTVGYGSAFAVVGDPFDPVSRTDELPAPKAGTSSFSGLSALMTEEPPTLQELKDRVAAANRKVQESQDDKSLRAASDALAVAVRDLQVGLNRTAKGQAEVKVIPLKHTAATEVERVLRELFNKRPVQINSLVRTNAIILQGTPADLESLAAVIKLLDEHAEKDRK